MIKKGFSHIGIFFLHLLSFVPLWMLYGISNVLYYILYYIVKYRRTVVRNNLSKSFPEKSTAEIIATEKKFYRYLGDLMVEIVKMSSITEAEVMKRVNMTNFELAEAYAKRGESVLACTGHYGNWELCMLAAGLNFSATCNVIYKPINNEVFGKWFDGLRTKFGNVFIPMKQTLRQVIATKNEVTMFCFASDQTPRKSDVQYRLNFMNQSTPAFLGLEKIALQTNRPIFYFNVKRPKRGYYEIDCVPMCLDPKSTNEHEITDMFFNHLTDTILQEPAYWLWSHKRWKAND